MNQRGPAKTEGRDGGAAMLTMRRIVAIGAGLALATLASAVAAANVPIPPTAAPGTVVPPARQPPRDMPPLDSVALPGEQPILAALVRDLATVQRPDFKRLLAILDRSLADLPRPTMLRGSVQMMRAAALNATGRQGEAMAAIEESIRLLPDYSSPLMAAAELHTYSNNPGLAADDLLRASRINPDAVRALPDYHLDALMLRLEAVRDLRRARVLGDRLLAIGWTGSGVRGRSALAKVAIQRAVAEGDIARARRLVPDLLDPGAAYELLALTSFRPIWADLEAWGGPMLSSQWRMYLDEARRRWEASGDLQRGADYATALRAAGDDDRVIATFLPSFDAPHVAERDWPMLFIAPRVASALMARGRIDEALSVYDRAARTWPPGSSANALNLAANRAAALLNGDRPAEALKQIDLAIDNSHRWPREVNSNAIASMHRVRACALHALGRGDEAAISGIIAAQAGHARQEAEVAICAGDLAAARAAIVKGLTHPEERPDLISFLQREGKPPIPSAYGRIQRTRADLIRADPIILAAIAPYGRVMAYAVNDGAPISINLRH